jgi:hypothetical protein
MLIMPDPTSDLAGAALLAAVFAVKWFQSRGRAEAEA